jgi:hypothetical protein
MPTWSETPIFPAKINNDQEELASGSAETTTIFTANTNCGSVVNGIILYEKGTGARTCRLELKNGSTTTVLSRFATSGNQYTSTNLFTSTYIPGLDDDDPILRLQPGDSLQITTEGTESNAIDTTVFGGDYEYPN